MLYYHLALISESNHLSVNDLIPVAAALTKQFVRDFAPMWRRTVIVSVFPSVKATPVGYYKLIVKDNIHMPGAAGYHTDDFRQPYALIQFNDEWTITTSHEALELIADPWGNRLYPGIMHGKPVLILEELCDPCEAFSYKIDGVEVSDFITPEWYDPETLPGKHYSFLHSIPNQHQVVQGGYVSWLDPADHHWYQETNFGTPQVIDLGASAKILPGFDTIKEAIDYYGESIHPES